MVNLLGNLLDTKINVSAMVIDICWDFPYCVKICQSQMKLNVQINTPHFLSIDLSMIKASNLPSELPEKCQFRNLGQNFTFPQFHFQVNLRMRLRKRMSAFMDI